MPRGNSMPGERKGGRKKGVPNKRTVAARELRDKAIGDGEMPLEYMLREMRDPAAGKYRRDDLARAAAPYVHPRFRCVEHTGADGGPIEVQIRWLREP